MDDITTSQSCSGAEVLDRIPFATVVSLFFIRTRINQDCILYIQEYITHKFRIDVCVDKKRYKGIIRIL